MVKNYFEIIRSYIKKTWQGCVTIGVKVAELTAKFIRILWKAATEIVQDVGNYFAKNPCNLKSSKKKTTSTTGWKTLLNKVWTQTRYAMYSHVAVFLLSWAAVFIINDSNGDLTWLSKMVNSSRNLWRTLYTKTFSRISWYFSNKIQNLFNKEVKVVTADAEM